MTKLTTFAARFAKDENGATAIEYGLLAALISVACVTIWGTVGGDLNTIFGTVSTQLQAANTSAGGTAGGGTGGGTP